MWNGNCTQWHSHKFLSFTRLGIKTWYSPHHVHVRPIWEIYIFMDPSHQYWKDQSLGHPPLLMQNPFTNTCITKSSDIFGRTDALSLPHPTVTMNGKYLIQSNTIPSNIIWPFYIGQCHTLKHPQKQIRHHLPINNVPTYTNFSMHITQFI